MAAIPKVPKKPFKPSPTRTDLSAGKLLLESTTLAIAGLWLGYVFYSSVGSSWDQFAIIMSATPEDPTRLTFMGEMGMLVFAAGSSLLIFPLALLATPKLSGAAIAIFMLVHAGLRFAGSYYPFPPSVVIFVSANIAGWRSASNVGKYTLDSGAGLKYYSPEFAWAFYPGFEWYGPSCLFGASVSSGIWIVLLRRMRDRKAAAKSAT